MIKSLKSKYSVLVESLICVIGIIIFSVFSHRKFLPFILSFAGLVIAVIIIIRHARTVRDLRFLFGINKISGTTVIYIIIAIIFGVLIGIIYRKYQRNFILPDKLTCFAILAVLIGSMEELIFRGFIQGHTRRIGIIFSILFATLSHTAYKCSLFLTHQSGFETDLMFLMKWTIFGGIIFSVIREYSGNVIPPLVGHAVFDLVVYGDNMDIPWWVWS